MQVQYLVGLCCQKRDPESVEIIIGDLVYDAQAMIERDVDITVLLEESPGVVRAFRAYEVKRHSRRLDVEDVEQLCAKLKAIPSVTHPAIVSASGYSAGAVNKARSFGVDLYELSPWEVPAAQGTYSPQLPGSAPIRWVFTKQLLVWDTWYIDHRFSEAHPPFEIDPQSALLQSDGSQHPLFPTVGAYWHGLLQRSTETLIHTKKAKEMIGRPEGDSSEPSWSHTHSMDVGPDEAYLCVGEGILRIEAVHIDGQLRLQHESLSPVFQIIRRVPDGEIFAGAAVTAGPNDGELHAITISPDSWSFGIDTIRLAPRHANAIRQLQLRSRERNAE